MEGRARIKQTSNSDNFHFCERKKNNWYSRDHVTGFPGRKFKLFVNYREPRTETESSFVEF